MTVFMIDEFSLISVIGILIGLTIPALILGSKTNFIFKKEVNNF